MGDQSQAAGFSFVAVPSTKKAELFFPPTTTTSPYTHTRAHTHRRTRPFQYKLVCKRRKKQKRNRPQVTHSIDLSHGQQCTRNRFQENKLTKHAVVQGKICKRIRKNTTNRTAKTDCSIPATQPVAAGPSSDPPTGT